MEEYGRVAGDVGVKLKSCFPCCYQDSKPTKSGIRITYKARMVCDSWHTMSCVYLVFLTLMLLVVECSSRDLPAVHWNSTNPMFKTSNNDHIIEVMMGDLLDFTCPYYTTSTDPMYQEHYIIYQVSRQEYENCNFYADSTSIMIVNCSKPRFSHRYTIFFGSFIANPNAPEFKSGETYYYITTSTGYREGLTNTDSELGACHTRNMRLSIKVCCDPTTTSTTTTSTPPVPTTRRQHHSTPRWRSSTRFTKNPDGAVKPTKPSDKDKSKEDDKDNPESGGQDGANCSGPVSLSTLSLLCSVLLTVVLRTR